MPMQETIKEIEAGDVTAAIHFDSDMGRGQHCWMTVEGQGWSLRRTFWFESRGKDSIEDFFQKPEFVLKSKTRCRLRQIAEDPVYPEKKR